MTEYQVLDVLAEPTVLSGYWTTISYTAPLGSISQGTTADDYCGPPEQIPTVSWAFDFPVAKLDTICKSFMT